ncbi:MAG: Maf family protein [Myxococcota bacterium]|nr:Maf family protein [Myxococcota bacterium]
MAALPRLVLASASPRRRDLLEAAGVRFEVCPADLPEERREGEPADVFARRTASSKARAVAARLDARAPRLVLGADTVVVVGEQVLGKPTDPADAVRLLALLVGRTHCVLTGVSLLDRVSGWEGQVVVETRVRMRTAGEEELRDYVATGEPLDKAGAYAVQGEGGRRFVEALEGSESNVIGLPLEETLALLREAEERTSSAASPAPPGERTR